MGADLAIGLGFGAVALAIAALPVLRRDRGGTAEDGRAVDRLVARAGEALASDSVCARCWAANPSGARFCGTCGRRLEGVAEAPVDDDG